MFEISKRQVTLLSLIFLVKCFKKQLTIGSRIAYYLIISRPSANSHRDEVEATIRRYSRRLR